VNDSGGSHVASTNAVSHAPRAGDVANDAREIGTVESRVHPVEREIVRLDERVAGDRGAPHFVGEDEAVQHPAQRGLLSPERDRRRRDSYRLVERGVRKGARGFDQRGRDLPVVLE
jgi:hypothetical protein